LKFSLKSAGRVDDKGSIMQIAMDERSAAVSDLDDVREYSGIELSRSQRTALMILFICPDLPMWDPTGRMAELGLLAENGLLTDRGREVAAEVVEDNE
jgi:hypothetical protein